jgi:hypothetical protein
LAASISFEPNPTIFSVLRAFEPPLVVVVELVVEVVELNGVVTVVEATLAGLVMLDSSRLPIPECRLILIPVQVCVDVLLPVR